MIIEIAVGVVGGRDVDPWRAIAMSVLERLQHTFLYEVQDPDQRGGIVLTCWDYHLDAPAVVPGDSLADRSLRIVDRSDGLIAIFGNRLPSITREEVWRAFEKRRKGIPQEIWIYFDPREKPPELIVFFDDIKAEFGEEPRWSECPDELDFQGKVFTTMIAFLLRHTAIPFTIEGEVE